jgi:hypothetical protein
MLELNSLLSTGLINASDGSNCARTCSRRLPQVMDNYFTTSLNPSGNRWIDSCSAIPSVNRSPQPIVGFEEDENGVEGLVVTYAAKSSNTGGGLRWRHQIAVGPFGPEGEI